MNTEHIVELQSKNREALIQWLAAPNGALWFGRVCFEAVENGAILVRTLPFATGEVLDLIRDQRTTRRSLFSRRLESHEGTCA